MYHLKNSPFDFVKKSSTPFVFISESKKIIYINPAAESFFLYSDEELKNADIKTIIELRDNNKFLDCEEKINAFALTSNGEKRKVSFFASDAVSVNDEKVISLSITHDSVLRDDETKHLVNSSTDMMWGIDRDFILTAANTSFFSFLKNVTGKVFKIGDNLAEHPFTKKYIDEWQNDIETVLSGKRVRKLKHIPAFPQYAESWIEISAYPVMRENEKITGISCHVTPRTKSMKAEQELILSNERYVLAATATRDSICDWDITNDVITRTGHGFKNSFGYDNDTATSLKAVLELIHPEDIAGVIESQNRTLSNKNKNYLEREFRFLKGDGKYAYVLQRGYIIRDAEGNPLRMIAAMQDITQRKKDVNKIKELQENTAALINNAKNAIWSVDRNLKIITGNTEFSRQYIKLSGKIAEKGDYIFSGSSQKIFNFWKGPYKKALEGKSVAFKHQETDKKGNVTGHYLINFTPIKNKEGEVTGVACFSKNMTELILSNRKLWESQLLFNKLFELSPQPMGLYNRDSLRFSQVNRAAKDLFGYSRNEFLNLKVTDLLAKNEKFKQHFAASGIVKHITRHGEQIDVEIFNSEIDIDGKRHILAVGIDQTQKLIDDKKVSRAIIKAQENERYEIGSELHDNICQLLASSKMRMSMLKGDLPETKRELFEQSREYLDAALEEIRNLSHRLAPSFFNDRNLEEAFNKLLQTFDIQGKYQVSTYFDANLSCYDITSEMKLQLYRILQEQMRNIISHANARKVEVDVVVYKNRLTMRVADDGSGFNVKNVKRGIGLSNMRRRAEIFDGIFNIVSSPECGTEITVALPVSRREQKV